MARALYLGAFALVVLSCAWLWWPDEPVSPQPMPVAEQERSPLDVLQPQQLEAVVVTPVESPSSAQHEVPAPPASTSAARPATPRPPKRAPHALEATLLARARAELAEEPETALRTLAELRQATPAAPPLAEAELLRLEALIRTGRQPEADTLARKLATLPGLKRQVGWVLRDVRPD